MIQTDHAPRISRGAVRDVDLARISRVTAAAAATAALIGMGVFLGWALDIPGLRSLPPDPIVMLPNTSIGITLASASLWLQRSEHATRVARRTAFALAALAFALGLASFIERISGFSTSLDRLFFVDAVRNYPYRPLGLMATNSTVCLTLAGLSLLLTAVEVRGERRPSQFVAMIGLAIAALALVGHLYGAPALYAMDAAAGMALITALAFAALHSGILFSRPTQGAVALLTGNDLGGVLARRQLPATILVPLILGWFWLRGRDQGLYSRQGGIAFLAVLTIGVLLSVVLRSAIALRTADREREGLLEREELARTEAERLAETLQGQTMDFERQSKEARASALEAEQASLLAQEAAVEAEHARSVADDANRAKMEFLSMMSHELRTPLNAIDGYAQLLEMGIRGPLTPQQAEDVGRIRRSERHLLAIVNDLLNFTRIDAGHLEWRLTDVDVAEVMAEAEPILLPEIAAKHLTYSNGSRGTPVRVVADREKLQQILVNLLNNACKFTPDNGRVSVSYDTHGDRVHIVVRDSGRGIRADKLNTIFEPFVQIDRHLMRDGQQGVGLGLAISRDLATGMGGDLTVESTVGEGSAFTLTLPRSSGG